MSKTLYTTATVLLLLFAIGHQLGFRKVDPSWHADQVVQAMQNVRMDVGGFQRTYWDFFSGFGFFVTALLLFSALTAWTLGHSSAGADLGLLRWSMALCYVVIAVLTWLNFFLVPGIFATAVALCLVAAAALA
jgi:hypothetical protein